MAAVALPISFDSLIGFAIATAVFVGGALAYFRFGKSNIQDNAIKALEATVRAQEITVNAQKEQLHTDAVAIAELKATVAGQTTHIDLLKALVTGVPDWKQLHTDLEALTTLMKAHAAESEQILAALNNRAA